MTSEIITCRDAGTGDVCLRILHPSGLEIRVMEMPDFSTAYAQFGTKFGAAYRSFRIRESGQTIELPAGTAHYLEHKLFEKEDGDVAKHGLLFPHTAELLRSACAAAGIRAGTVFYGGQR